MLEKIAATGMDGRQSKRGAAQRHANALAESIRDYAGGNCLGHPRREISARFLLDTHFHFRAVLLDTPIRAEMDVSSLAASQLRALLDTYFDPSLLDTQMQNLPQFGALIFLESQ